MVMFIMVKRDEPKVQERFISTLAQLALLKDESQGLTAQCGKLYQWIWRYEEAMKDDNDTKNDKGCRVGTHLKRHVDGEVKKDSNCVLPTCWKWVLQLRTKDKKWVNWIYVKRSNRSHANLGVFAARDFPRGSTIGYYCGKTVWTSKVCGGEKPRVVDVVKEKELGKCGLVILIAKAKWQVIVAEEVGKEGTPEECHLYLGMHYITSACSSFERGSREYEKAKREQNCVIGDDGSVKAVKKIPPHYELLTEDGEQYFQWFM